MSELAQASLQAAYDAARAQQLQRADYEEIRNGLPGDRTGEQERSILAPLDHGQFKATYKAEQQQQPQDKSYRRYLYWLLIALAVLVLAYCVMKR